MLRSLFTGISGLTAHQQMLDVTANNIANVNTTGFKSSRAAFQDTLSQTLQGAAAPRNTTGATPLPITGGTNAMQIGLGVKLAGTEMDMGQGSTQTTGVATDMMINGDGFFVVQKGDNQQAMYTRAGGFHLDQMGHFVTADGAVVSGVGATAGKPDAQPTDATGLKALDLSPLLNGYDGSGPIVGTPPTGTATGKYVSYTVDTTGTVTAVRDDGTTDVLGQLTLATFANPNGLAKIGNTEFSKTGGSGDPVFGAADSGSFGNITTGELEMSNVDLSAQLTDLIIAQRGFQANSKTVTTADQILQTLVTLKQ